MTFHDENQKALASLAGAPPVTIELQPMEAWVLLCMVQLAYRHPAMTDSPLARIARMAAEKLRRPVAPDGALARLAEMGWEPEWDDFEGMNG